MGQVKLLQSMHHPNILSCVDGYIDPHTNELVIVLEWAQGGDMKALIRRVKKANRGFSERQVGSRSTNGIVTQFPKADGAAFAF